MSDLFLSNFEIILQLILALGLINVWLVRFYKPTKYRGDGSKNMLEEFKAYGLPEWFMYTVGFMKILIAVFFMIGLFVPVLVLPSAILLCLLMVGAISMHLKIKDSFKKTMPAIFMFLLSTVLVILKII